MAKPYFDDKFHLADLLMEARETGGIRRLESPVSYHLLRKAVDEGYLSRKEADSKQDRGRRARLFVISSQGREFLNKARRWKRPATA